MMVLQFLGLAVSGTAILAGRRAAALGLWLASLVGTLALVAFAALIAMAGLLLLIQDAVGAGPEVERGGEIFGKACLLLFFCVVLANAVSTAAECGGGLCPDDPTRYEALDPWLGR